MNCSLKVALVSFLVFAGSANASGSSSGQVTGILVVSAPWAAPSPSSDVAVFSAGSHSGKPACSVIGDDWSISLTTPSGRAMYALILSAQAQGKSVNVAGSNTCSAWGDRETPVWIQLQ